VIEALRDLFGPGLVLLVFLGWLVRKAIRAARTEREMEAERAAATAEPPAPPHLAPIPDALRGADVLQARAEHVALVAGEAGAAVLWVRTLGGHVAWLERLPAGAHALRVLRVEDGRRWTFE